MKHTNEVAIVTGASRGLGAVIARVLAGRGYNLVLGARDPGPLFEIADALGFAGIRVRTVPGDIASAAVQDSLIAKASDLGALKFVINNASELGVIEPLGQADLTRFSRVLDVNVIAPVALAQRAVPALERARGAIVNISSDAAVGGYAGWGIYGASKAALELAGRTLATELRERSIGVITVDPGDMRTRMHQEAFAGQDISDRPLPEITAPFWQWLFDQDLLAMSGGRFAAQSMAHESEDTKWLQPL